jgi:hypothetical protein
MNRGGQLSTRKGGGCLGGQLATPEGKGATKAGTAALGEGNILGDVECDDGAPS